jgi:predicted DCC family thiol-disulfide oxidoreductase YuxK
VIAGIIAWALVTFVVAPPIIRGGYENTSHFSFINHAFDYRHEHPIDFYMRKFNKLALAGLGAWIAFGLLVLGTTSRTFARNMIGTATPGALGAIRVLTCLICARAAYGEPIASLTKLSAAERTSMGVMDLIYAAPIGFDKLVHSADGLAAYKAITIIVMLIAALGIFTRPVMILGAILYLPLAGIVRSYSWFNHCGVIPFYILVVLIFTRSGDGWSLDRLIKVWRGKPVPPRDVAAPYYAWARYACWMVLAIPYVCAGFSKLTNPSNGRWLWWQGVNLQTILYRDALRPGEQHFILDWAWMGTWAFTIMGVMTIVTEVGMGLVLVSRYARMVWPILTAGMHVGIQWLQHILFWDLIVLQVIFYDWTKVRHWLGHRLNARRGSIDVLYDGRCSLCQRSVRLLKGWDLLDRLNYLDFRALDLKAYDDARHVALDPAALDRAMHVVHRGRVTSGFEGCRSIAGALPIFWIIVPLLWLPGLSHLGAAAYRWLARNRMAFHTCDASGACALPSHTESSATPQRSGAELRDLPIIRKLLGPAVVTSIVCFMLGAWCLRIEWFPFTSMQMFSTYDDSGVVTYYRAMATDAFGNTYEAPLEKMGRGVSRYRPILSGGFFNAAGRKRCVEMLEFCGSTHNEMNPKNPVVKLEVEKREWDFLHDRESRDYGNVVDRITVTFPTSATARG